MMSLRDHFRRFFPPEQPDRTPPPKSRLLGWRLSDGRPQYIPDDFNECHWWGTGATRSGKTARFMYPMIKDRIDRNDGPVVVIDLKGEDWQFQAVKKAAEDQGRRFFWLTNMPYFSSYIYNPLEQGSLRRLPVSQQVQSLLVPLNLYHGPGYGRDFFDAGTRRRLRRGYERSLTRVARGAWMPTETEPTVRSFSSLLTHVQEQAQLDNDKKAAEHLVSILEDLAAIPQINFSYGGREHPQAAIENAIHVPDLLVPDENGKYPVVYLYLRSQIGQVECSQIAKMFLHDLQRTCAQASDFRKMGQWKHPVPKVPTFCDEWQNIADASLKGIIETGSGFGIELILANQDPSQLKSADCDLSTTIWENAGNRVFFTARDPQLQRTLVEISGERTEHVPSYSISHPAWKAGKVKPEDALHVLNGQWAPLHVAPQQVPRMSQDDVIRMSASFEPFLYVPPYASPEHELDGYPVVLSRDFSMSKGEMETFKGRAWPAPTPETIVPEEIIQTAT